MVRHNQLASVLSNLREIAKLEGVKTTLLEDEGAMQMHTCTRKPSTMYELAGRKSGVIVVEILSNWGADETCLYRVRVHGHPADVKHV